MNTQAKPFFLLLLLTFFGSSQANVVTINDTNVLFTYEESFLNNFGKPTVSGAQLLFTPSIPNESASDLMRFDLNYSTINVEVNTISSDTIYEVNLIEKGNFTNKRSNSYLDTGRQIQIKVAETSRPLYEVADVLTLNSLIVNQSSFFSTQHLQAPDGVNALTFEISKVIITIENILVAFSNAFDNLGFIEKKAVVLRITSIPLPAGVWLFGTALLGFLAYFKRTHYI